VNADGLTDTSSTISVMDPESSRHAVGDGRTLNADGLRAWCKARLRSSLTPETIEVWPELPATESVKVVRREVGLRLARRAAESAATVLT
jgi:acyl-coenzyme A synthetase/AMP-(fatty) acid ligase